MSLKEEDRQAIVSMELEKADYNCYYDVTESEITAYIEPAQKLIEKIKYYIAKGSDLAMIGR